jgi:hypothetical protein
MEKLWDEPAAEVARGTGDQAPEPVHDVYDGALEYDGVISNVNTQGLEEMSDAVAHAVLLYAISTSSVSGTGKASDQATVATGERWDNGRAWRHATRSGRTDTCRPRRSA